MGPSWGTAEAGGRRTLPAMLAFGLLLMAAAMAVGLFALVRRGYELIAAITMTVLLVLGLAAVVKGVIG